MKKVTTHSESSFQGGESKLIQRAAVLTVVLTLALVFVTSDVMAVWDLGLFELDGDAVNDGGVPGDDWDLVYSGSDNAEISTFVVDTVGQLGDDIFTEGGSKDINDISEWQWKYGSPVPDKDNILDAFLAVYPKPGTGTPVLYFGADRYANNGDAQIGFWFVQDDLGLKAGGSFTGTHQVGDLLVLSDFTQGGAISTISVYQWVGSGGSDDTIDLVASGVDCASTPAGAPVCATVNSQEENASWPFTPKFGTEGFFPAGSLYEGGLDIAQLEGFELGCFTSFLAETRTSQSVDAQLKDFALGGFKLCGLEVDKTGPTLSKAMDDARYTVTITNDGAVVLYKQSIVDSLTGDLTNGTNPAIVSSDCGASLDPLQSCIIVYDSTVQAGDPDPLINTVSVVYNQKDDFTGDTIERSAEWETNLFQPAVEVIKTGDELSKVGDPVDYTITVNNLSSADSPNLVNGTIVDTLLGDLLDGANPFVAASTCTGTLATGASCTIEATRTVQAGDPDPLPNTVEVHYNPDGFENDIWDDDSHEVNLFQPSGGLNKTGDPLSKVGDDVNYTLTLANTSSADTPAFECNITDPLLGLDIDVVLMPGETWQEDYSYTVQPDDPDPLVNTMNVLCGIQGFPNQLGGGVSVTTNLFQPAVEVIKIGDSVSFPGFDVIYDYTINNLSSPDSPDLILESVLDDVLGDLTAAATAAGCDILATPGGTCHFQVLYTLPVPQSDPLVNVVTVLYHPARFANDITDDDDHSIEVLQPTELLGKKFEDMNADGVWDAGEPGLAGVEITLEGTDVFGNNVLATDVTDANGDFSFPGLVPGDYTVTETAWPAGGWMPSTPTSSGPHTLGSGETLDLSWVFGNYRYAVKAGYKMNADLRTPLSGWTIELWDISGTPFFVDSTVTDGTGAYLFDDVMPGSTYDVCEVLQLGYIQTFPEELTTPPDDELIYDCDLLGQQAGYFGRWGYEFYAESGDEYMNNDFGNIEPQGCTFTQGYWKTHSYYGPAGPEDPGWYTTYGPYPPGTLGPDAPLFDSGMTWYETFSHPIEDGNAWFILAKQWMAGYLNVYNFAGTGGTDVVSWLGEGSALLDAYDQYDDGDPLIPNGTADRDRAITLADLLDQYNSGYIGPGSCPE